MLDPSRFINSDWTRDVTKNVTFHIVPKIELQVTGTGVPGSTAPVPFELKPHVPLKRGGRLVPLGEPPAPPTAEDARE